MARAFLRTELARWLPGLVTLRQYQAEWLTHDIVAGLVLATMLVPVGIAYAVASGVPGQVTSVDVTAADMLAELDETLHADGIELCFAALKDPVKDKLKRFGLFVQIGQEYFFPTIETAVRSYVQKYADRVD